MTWLEIKNILDEMTDQELKQEASVRCPQPNCYLPIALHPIYVFDRIGLMESPPDKPMKMETTVFDVTGNVLANPHTYAIYFDYPGGSLKRNF